ncbi:MAG TPA: hypothetical protein VEU77_03285 [Candidatus Acidoferrales bacterium]|nr:hypothetical protein [Candidatus Acidoferrales bacterium]
MILAGALAAATAAVAVVLACLPPRMPTLPRHPDASSLALALPGWSLARWELLRVALAATAVIAFGQAWFVAAPAALVTPSVVLRWREHVLRGRAAAACTVILQTTHAGLRSGQPLVAALRSALQPHAAPARAPFDEALRAFDLNTHLADALVSAGVRAADRRVAIALDALALAAAEDLPAARAAALIGSVAERLAFESELRSEVDARSSGARTQILILALVVPLFALYLAATMPGLSATLASPIGARVLVPAALVLEVAGIVASRAIIAGLEL